MAYVQNQGSGNRAPMGRPAVAGTTTKREAIFSTGLFAPNKPGVKSKGNIQLKEDVILPAGSYINLYEVDERKSDKSPVYRLQVTAGKLKDASELAATRR